MQPLVTCICPTTGGRASWLPQAIECFQSQTYQNRVLLIVSDSDMCDVVTYCIGKSLKAHRKLRIGIVFTEGLSLGTKRNFACANAFPQSELIAHFDDDDWSASSRLAFQVERLQSTGLAVTGLSRMRFTDGANWWRYHDPQWPLGTSLCYRKDWWDKNRFPDTQVGSDTTLIYEAKRQKQVDIVDCGDLMFARVHPGNTNKRTYGLPSFEPAEAMCFA